MDNDKIELWVRNNELDNRLEFRIVMPNEDIYNRDYLRWIWFYMGYWWNKIEKGKHFKESRIFPFMLSGHIAESKKLGEWKLYHSAHNIGEWIVKKIDKYLKENKLIL